MQSQFIQLEEAETKELFLFPGKAFNRQNYLDFLLRNFDIEENVKSVIINRTYLRSAKK